MKSQNAKILLSSKSFHRLLNETLAAVKDSQGNIFVGTATNIPSTNAGVVTLSNGQQGNQTANNGTSNESPISKVGQITAAQNNANSEESVAPPVNTTSNGTSGVSGTQQTQPQNVPPITKAQPNSATTATGLKNIQQESWMIPNQELWENPNTETGILKWPQIEYIANDMNSEFNVATRVFIQMVEYGQLARYLVKKFASETGHPTYNRQSNIDQLQDFISKNKEKLFEVKIVGPHYYVFFHFGTSFDGWSGSMAGFMQFRINGAIVNDKMQIKTTKVPKRENQNDNNGIPFGDITKKQGKQLKGNIVRFNSPELDDIDKEITQLLK